MGYPRFSNSGVGCPSPTTLRSPVSLLKSPQSPGVLYSSATYTRSSTNRRYHHPRMLSAISCNDLQDALDFEQAGPHVRMAQILLLSFLLL